MADVSVVPDKAAPGRRLWSIAPPPWLSGYQRKLMVADALAGLTLWALLVPEAIAYASVAGIPAQFGLYSVPLALLAYAWFGSSQRLVMAPTSTIAALTATVIAPLAAAATDSYVLLTAVLSLLVGGIYLVLAAFKLGFISRIFARPVLDGFIVGLGVYIAVGQLPKVAGVEKPEGNTVNQFIGLFREIPEWHRLTLLIGVGSFLTLMLLEHVAPKVPAPIVVVVVSVALVGALDLEAQGVEVVGDIPQGFAMLTWTGVTLSEVWSLLPGALGIVVVGFAQSLAIAKAYAAKEHTKVDADRELMAYGVASIGAGVLQGMPPSGSLSKSAATERAGARTAMAFVVSVVLVVLTILFLTGLFVNLPEAALAAIVIHAVMGMIQPLKIWGLRQVRVPDFWLALFAFLGVLLIGVMAGIVIGVVLSLLLLLLRLGSPHTAVLGRAPRPRLRRHVREPRGGAGARGAHPPRGRAAGLRQRRRRLGRPARSDRRGGAASRCRRPGPQRHLRDRRDRSRRVGVTGRRPAPRRHGTPVRRRPPARARVRRTPRPGEPGRPR